LEDVLQRVVLPLRQAARALVAASTDIVDRAMGFELRDEERAELEGRDRNSIVPRIYPQSAVDSGRKCRLSRHRPAADGPEGVRKG
jgi:hypothetical protein